MAHRVVVSSGGGDQAADQLRGSSTPTDWRRGLWRVVPYVFALTAGFQLLRYVYIEPHVIGFDARLYAAAARDWLQGGNPWETSMLGIYFAAPPPTLLAFVPFTVLSPATVSVIWVVGSVALAIAALRSLGMPLWWLAFWPILDGILIGNPDVAVLALLVLARGRLSAVAPLFKIYAFLPMFAERRVGQIALALGLLALSFPFLPWFSWIEQLPTVTDHLRAVSPTTSVFGHPVGMAIAVAALAALGIRRAGWLAVPALWPYTQVHYLALSVPAMSAVLAIAWSFPHPIIVVTGLVIEAVRQHRSVISRVSVARLRGLLPSASRDDSPWRMEAISS